jgi:hypothetical protein
MRTKFEMYTLRVREYAYNMLSGSMFFYGAYTKKLQTIKLAPSILLDRAPTKIFALVSYSKNRELIFIRMKGSRKFEF